MKDFIILLLVIVILPLFSTIIEVNPSGSADYITIQEGINSSVDSDTVLVHPGTYLENIDFQGKNIDSFKNLKKYYISNSKEYKSLDHRIEDVEIKESYYRVQLLMSLKKMDRRDSISEKEYYVDIELEDCGSDLLKIVSLKNKN